MNDPYPIPPGLSPEQEQVFKVLAESNANMTQQLKQIQVVVKGSSEIRTGPKDSGHRREKAEIHGFPIKPVSAIREFCIQCVGGSKNNRKPWKAVRECVVSNCPLHSFRMGKNPFHKRNPAENSKS